MDRVTADQPYIGACYTEAALYWEMLTIIVSSVYAARLLISIHVLSYCRPTTSKLCNILRFTIFDFVPHKLWDSSHKSNLGQVVVLQTVIVFLDENIKVTEERTAWRKEVVQLEQLTPELTTLTKVK